MQNEQTASATENHAPTTLHALISPEMQRPDCLLFGLNMHENPHSSVDAPLYPAWALDLVLEFVTVDLGSDGLPVVGWLGSTGCVPTSVFKLVEDYPERPVYGLERQDFSAEDWEGLQACDILMVRALTL